VVYKYLSLEAGYFSLEARHAEKDAQNTMKKQNMKKQNKREK